MRTSWARMVATPLPRSAPDRPEVTIGRALDDALAAGRDDPLAADEEGTVDAVVLQRVEAFDDVADRRRVQRDVVGVAVHERDLLRVHADLRLIAGHQRATALGACRPVQDLV